jgi:hypothetical protein
MGAFPGGNASADKMKLTDGLFIRCAKEIHDREFPEIAYLVVCPREPERQKS